MIDSLNQENAALRAKVEELKHQKASFFMEYRMLCDEDTKRLENQLAAMTEERDAWKNSALDGETTGGSAEMTVMREAYLAKHGDHLPDPDWRPEGPLHEKFKWLENGFYSGWQAAIESVKA